MQSSREREREEEPKNYREKVEDMRAVEGRSEGENRVLRAISSIHYGITNLQAKAGGQERNCTVRYCALL
ncbi:hypothetical protein TIFTF001_015956 [Ficus carica]|nr:hypothetical protein TIFTF001_015956 [Ficus carica]